jgi:hypothetical protein
MNDDEDLPRSSIASTGHLSRGRIRRGRNNPRERMPLIAGLA